MSRVKEEKRIGSIRKTRKVEYCPPYASLRKNFISRRGVSHFSEEIKTVEKGEEKYFSTLHKNYRKRRRGEVEFADKLVSNISLNYPSAHLYQVVPRVPQ